MTRRLAAALKLFLIQPAGFRAGGTHDWKRPLLLATAVVYLAALGFSTGVLFRNGGTIKDAGWTWETTPRGAMVRSVDPRGPAAGLSAGSRILAVNGDQRAAHAGPRPWLQTVQPGERYEIVWETPEGRIRSATVAMGLRRSGHDLEMGLCDLFLSLSFAAAGFLVWAAKSNDLLARPAYIASLLTAFYLLGSSIGPESPQLSGASLAAYLALKSIFPFYMTAGCSLFARFPTGEAPPKPWRIVFLALLVLGMGAWLFSIPQRFFPHMGLEWRLSVLSGLDLNLRPELSDTAAKHGYVVLCALYIISVTVFNYRKLTSEAMRLRVRWVVLGVAAGVSPVLLYSLVMALADAAHWLPPGAVRRMVQVYSLSTLSLVAIPATLVYAILANRLMGIKVAISTGFQLLAARRVFQIVTLLPAVPIAAYMWSRRHQPFAEPLTHPEISVPLAFAALMLVFRKELLDAVDGLLIRLRGAHQSVVQDLLETLFGAHSIDAIGRTAAERIRCALAPERMIIYCAQSDVHALSRVYASAGVTAPDSLSRASVLAITLSEKGTSFLGSTVLSHMADADRAWITASGLTLAVPIAGALRTELSGVMLLGDKLTGDPYWATDVDLLEDVARQVYLALRVCEVENDRDRALRERQETEEAGRNRSQLLAQISHELRNPLHGVVGLTNLLLDTPLDADQKSYAESIRRSGEWTAAIADDVLNLSKLDAGSVAINRVQFEWLTVLEDLATIAAERARAKNLEIVLQIDADTPVLAVGDPTRIRQVLLNLLDNAVKATEHGWVLIHARRGSDGPNTESMAIVVQDTGPGIPESRRDRLFVPFARDIGDSGDPGGSGLGLAISKRLANMMGGDLIFAPVAGKGARFVFTLPAPPAAVPPVTASKPLEGVRILVIDPLVVSLRAACLNLSALGASPIPFVSQADPAVVGLYDAVIISGGDIKQTVSDIRQVRRLQPGVPVIVSSRGGCRLSKEETDALGAIEQVRRPAPRQVLLRAIRKALDLRPEASSDPRAGDEDLRNSCAGVRILVVEDDPATMKTHQMMLAHLGCVVLTAHSARDALAVLASHNPDLVLVDGALSGMDGVELTRSIRLLDPPACVVPVVAVCGDAISDWRRRFFDAGANDYLVKPAAASELREVIRIYVKRNVAR
jgi:signal transduction histidine kinase/ActR/RegA family two-component response regulator